MFRKYLLPLLAVVGAIFAVKTVVAGAKPTPAAPPVAAPAVPPFEKFVAGAGLVEASNENVAIGAPLGGLVMAVPAKVGDTVAAAAPLFRLDDRTLQAQRAVAAAALEVAKARLLRLEQAPRAEDLPPLEARVKEAEIGLEDARDELSMWESVTDPRAVARDLLTRKKFAAVAAESRLVTARSELEKTKSGTWAPDLAVARAEVQSAEAALLAVDLELERLIVRAPAAGILLQVKVRAGEYAQAGALAQPLMLLGAAPPFHVRVDVDENDAWRVKSGARAHANLRGNRDLGSPLEFVRFEPYVIPKRSLTGDATERVDTRVLQVIFKVTQQELPLFVGQQMDVFIEEAP